MFLSESFLSQYPDFPENMTELGKFTYLRTYSRVVEESGLKRRESFKETVTRAVNYNIGLASSSLPTVSEINEAERIFDSIFSLNQFPSGRTLWVGGAETGVADKYPTSNFNCSYTATQQYPDLGELFYMLMVGTGVGFRCSLDMAANMLKPLYRDISIGHDDYYVAKSDRLQETETSMVGEELKITVGDSKEGWVQALNYFFAYLSQTWLEGHVKILLDVSNVRPEGEPLKTFGGRASGPQPLIEMFDAIVGIVNGTFYNTQNEGPGFEDGYSLLRPIHILDIGNFIGNNVVVGGVRRTAEIFICDPDDYESIFAKFGINGIWGQESFDKLDRIEAAAKKAGVPLPEWWESIKVRYYQLDDGENTVMLASDVEEQPINLVGATLFNPGRPYHHRRMSNNSIGFIDKPSKEYLDFIFEIMQLEGEPGFINLYEAASRRLGGLGTDSEIRELAKTMGLNPCAEILLDSKGVCNLTTVNLANFVEDGVIQEEALLQAQADSARIGFRMTLPTLEMSEWDSVQKRDRLLGVSLTGWKDFVTAANLSRTAQIMWLTVLRNTARDAADSYADSLGLNRPLLVTTVKPEGTLSLVAGGVSAGVHDPFAEYYIRRIRLAANDPVAEAMKASGFKITPEVGTPGETVREQMENARVYVTEFPVHSPVADRHSSDVDEQLDTYFLFQKYYCEHNASNTISVKPEEWGRTSELIYKGWDHFTAVSFLAHDGGSHQLAPYEEISEDRFNTMLAFQPTLSVDLVNSYENGQGSDISEDETCDSGVCPIR